MRLERTTLVFLFVVCALKGERPAAFPVPAFLVGCLLNGAWGIGTAWLLCYIAGIGDDARRKTLGRAKGEWPTCRMQH